MPKFRYVLKEPDDSPPKVGPNDSPLRYAPWHPDHEAFMHSVGEKTFAERLEKQEIVDARS